MRILFIGSVKFSESLLKKLILNGSNIIGIIALSTKKYNSDYCDLIPLALENNISSISVEDVNSDNSINWIKEKKPDIIFCFGWSRILKKGLLSIPKIGVIGYHPSLLPNNRGRHPIIWSLVLGLQETGSTFFIMDEGVDSGDIISQRVVPISFDDTALTLYKKLELIAADQLLELLPSISNRTFKRIKQNTSFTNSWRKRSNIDGLIDWRMSSLSINNLVRALTKPYCGAYFKFKGVTITVWEVKSEKLFLSNNEPGKVLDKKNNSLIVKTGDGALSLTKIEPNISPDINSYL